MISWKAISQGCRSRQPSRKRARTSPSLAQRKGEGIRTGLVKSEEFKFVLQLKGYYQPFAINGNLNWLSLRSPS